MQIEETNQFTFQYQIYKHIAKINYLGVKRKFQKNGIGKKVVLDFIEKCKKMGIKHIKIDAYIGAKGFWEKIGFCIDEEPQIIYGHKQDYHNGILLIK